MSDLLNAGIWNPGVVLGSWMAKSFGSGTLRCKNSDNALNLLWTHINHCLVVWTFSQQFCFFNPFHPVRFLHQAVKEPLCLKFRTMSKLKAIFFLFDFSVVHIFPCKLIHTHCCCHHSSHFRSCYCLVPVGNQLFGFQTNLFLTQMLMTVHYYVRKPEQKQFLVGLQYFGNARH